MASLSASWLVMNKLADSHLIRMITFGQPRTGNKEYADAHDKMIPYKYRITHHRDPIPHLPVDGLEGYHHHLAEIFYNNDMTQPDYIGLILHLLQSVMSKKASPAVTVTWIIISLQTTFSISTYTSKRGELLTVHRSNID
ncbi:hypothetical protein WR25_03903 [Diploscapter pachys]|uniref:Fungal lipase-type domain-containing protein n=1 Tax=Diploscapter pachys TaxID=2018661 RepID=A0A2A2JNA6_9BILA|nr:hypothetical protein WR25_03903 [Diploscapter pachys]